MRAARQLHEEHRRGALGQDLFVVGQIFTRPALPAAGNLDVIRPGDLDGVRAPRAAVGGRRGGTAAVVLLPPLLTRRHGNVYIGQFTEVRVGVDEASGLSRFEQPNVVNLRQDGLLAVNEYTSEVKEYRYMISCQLRIF